nr:polysaccharide pyruvyl transferase family protein [Prevotella sp.]
MKIGLLAYHAVCNFGAMLQLLSTYMFLKNHGHEPVIINWVAKDLENYYAQNTPISQIENQLKLRLQLWKETALCRTIKDVANIISNEQIDAVIIGSDAVAQHHPLFERIVFPCRNIIAINSVTSDVLFPNPFWGIWTDYLDKPVPVALMSAASQDSKYKYISKKLRKQMKERIMAFSYVSVRDVDTQKMFSFITEGQCCPSVTPDPVFAFNQNAASLVPSKEELMKKYGLSGKYMLISFKNEKRCNVSQTWLNKFQDIAKHHGIQCVSLPFSTSLSAGELESEIALPLNPIDWYALLKYSCGYIGNNMHPIVVCIHNTVPFFSFDNYGSKHANGLFCDSSTSKIRHILKVANLLDCRIASNSLFRRTPSPEHVFNKLQTFDKAKCKNFAQGYLNKYNEMMTKILERLRGAL